MYLYIKHTPSFTILLASRYLSLTLVGADSSELRINYFMMIDIDLVLGRNS